MQEYLDNVIDNGVKVVYPFRSDEGMPRDLPMLVESLCIIAITPVFVHVSSWAVLELSGLTTVSIRQEELWGCLTKH